MIEARLIITADQAQALEDFFCEVYQENWFLHEDTKTMENQLRGYFDTESVFEELRSSLIELYPDLTGEWVLKPIVDADWKEAYKIHFKPWNERGLHWVPVWEKDSYDLPEGEQIVLLDPGMAFGTGNHETTRLCARRLLNAKDFWKSDVSGKSVIDAGCGSGILAISARKLGFESVYAFDNDPDSVRISLENEQLCGIEKTITFEWADLKVGLADRKADLVLANILANVLCEHVEILIDSVSPGGFLALSGILAKEVDQVHEVFARVIKERRGIDLKQDAKVEGEWADLCYQL